MNITEVLFDVPVAIGENETNDQKTREAALSPTQSFIVQAPAGSGKTGLLTQRLLRLLSCAEHAPEECVAITFTRKAAAEMRDRIIQALQRAQDPSPPTNLYEYRTWELAQAVLERDRQLEWNLLQNPNRLKIQTIDAFCAAIARQMPIVSQFGALPRTVEDAAPLYQLAAQSLLKSLETDDFWSGSVRILLSHLDNNLVLAERLLAEMLSHRDQWLPYVGRTFSSSGTQLREHLESGLQNVIRETLCSLVSSIPPGMYEILNLAQTAATELERLNSVSLITHCKNLSGDWPGDSLDDLPVWQGLGELFLTREHTLRKTLTEQQGFSAPSKATTKADREYLHALKTRMQDCLEQLDQYPNFKENLRMMRECPPPMYTDPQWQVVAALVQLLPVLTAELSLVFQEKGEVDFIEILLAALKALGDSENPTDLALGLDYKIRHLLVDEFQDTSASQFRLLEKLTAGWQPNDGRTLFLVGDPMQSIYRFRQAEVGLFLRAKQTGVGEIILKPLRLVTNFRSDPKLVEWTNANFETQFPLQDDISSNAIKFHPSSAAQVASSGAMAMQYSVTLESEAAVVVELIHTVQAVDPNGSIALLVRSRGHLQHLISALRDAQIPYQGIQLEKQGDRLIVQDLLSLTRALLHLGDRIAWLAILRTPWGYLSLSDLWCIANHEPALPLWHTLCRYSEVSGLSTTAIQCLARIVPILSRALSQSHRLPFRTWITETWIALGGAEYLYNERSLEDAEAFFAVLETADPNACEEPGYLEQQIQKLYAKTTTNYSNAVQIMTIHKAKGLEFDTVIVPGVGRRSRGDSAQLLLWEERVGTGKENYFLLAPIQAVGANNDPIYAYLRKQEAQRAAFEARRLEYVAATRARQRLYWLRHEPE